MKKGEMKKKIGFTMIEVSLVLAVAGLIFVIVFAMVPSLQRSQRDSKRREDVAVFLEAVKSYQKNNRGALPAVGVDWGRDDVLGSYLGDSFRDPDAAAYSYATVVCSDANNDKKCDSDADLTYMDHTMHIFTQAVCDGENAVPNSNPRRVAVVYRLEGSGTYCANT